MFSLGLFACPPKIEEGGLPAGVKLKGAADLFGCGVVEPPGVRLEPKRPEPDGLAADVALGEKTLWPLPPPKRLLPPPVAGVGAAPKSDLGCSPGVAAGDAVGWPPPNIPDPVEVGACEVGAVPAGFC